MRRWWCRRRRWWCRRRRWWCRRRRRRRVKSFNSFINSYI